VLFGLRLGWTSQPWHSPEYRTAVSKKHQAADLLAQAGRLSRFACG